MSATQVEVLKNVIGILFASGVMVWVYRGGRVKNGTVPMPIEGRVIVFVCGLLILFYSLKRLLIR